MSVELESNAFHTLQSLGDADVLIVKAAIDYCSSQGVIVNADDTYILVLLMYHMKPDYHVYFGPKIGKKFTICRIQDLCEAEEMSPYILFAHAWARCDTTSAIHNKGKVVLNLYL